MNRTERVGRLATDPSDQVGSADQVDEPIWFGGFPHRERKGFRESTHRACPPEETLERILPVLPLAGITRLADVTGLDRIGIPTILAMRPNAPTLSNSSGKGFTLAAAQVSAAMEGIELHCAEELRHPGDVGRFSFEALTATYAEVEADGLAIDADLFPPSQFSLFHREVLEEWVLGWDLIGQRRVAVPFDMVAMDGVGRQRRTPFSFQVGSNGLASGNGFLEAVCAGLSEVIERDAVTTALLAAGFDLRKLPRVDLQSVPYERVQDLVARLQGKGISPVLFDCTTDTAVATFMVYLADESMPTTGLFRGYGCHLHPEVAMVRAFTEAVQSRTVYIAGSRDDMMTLEHRRLRSRPSDTAIALGRAGGGRDLSGMSSQASNSFEGDCRRLLDAVERSGLHCAVAVDLTLPEIGVSVVRVVVPGLEGYSSFSFYAPGSRGRAAMAKHQAMADELPATPGDGENIR